MEVTKDNALKIYFKDRNHLADFINDVLLGGFRLIKPEAISYVDSETNAIIEAGSLIKEFSGIEDVLASIDDPAVGPPFFLGWENQSSYLRHMPMRVLRYNMLTLFDQYSRYRKEKDRIGKLNESLPDDRKIPFPKLVLTPLIVVVFYTGEKPWKSNRLLGDLYSEVNALLKPFLLDYRMALIDIKDIDASLFEEKDNRDLVKAIQTFYQWNGDVNKIRDMEMSREVKMVVAAITGIDDLIEQIGKEKGGETMCTSIINYGKKNYDDGFDNGEKNVVINLLKQNILSITQIADVTQLSETEILKIKLSL